MKVAGICSVCGGLAKPAFTCEMCGTVVCSRCYNLDLSLCERCSAQSRKIF